MGCHVNDLIWFDASKSRKSITFSCKFWFGFSKGSLSNKATETSSQEYSKMIDKTKTSFYEENIDTHKDLKGAEIALENNSDDDETADLKNDSVTSEVHQSVADCNSFGDAGLINESKIQEHAGQGTEQVLLSDTLFLAQKFKDLLESSIGQILSAFEQKLAYDATKQKQIDNLHAELQKHRSDLIARTNRPLVNGLISLYDDVGKLSENIRKKSIEEFDQERFFKAFESIKEDIEILLDQNGVISFSEQGEKFDPKRQHAVRQVKTLDNQLVGTIAERLRLGFEQGNDLIQKERVSVYIVDKTTLQQEDKTKVNTNFDAVEPCDVEKKNG
jgi:molecular chaperone GrpE